MQLDGLTHSAQRQEVKLQADDSMIPCFTYTKKILLAVIAVDATKAKMWSRGSVPQ